MTGSLSLVTSLRPSRQEDANQPRCFDIWTHLTDNFLHHNLTMDYQFHPDQVGQVLSFTVPEVNQSQSCRIQYLPFKTAAFTCLLLIVLLSLAGNLIVAINLYLNRRRWSKVNYFIMHLALADLAVLITPLVELITMLTHTWYGGRWLCKFYRVISAFGLYLSSFIVTSIAIDRFLAVSRPLSITTAGRRARLLLAVSVGASLLCSLPQAVVFDLLESNFFKEYNAVCVQVFAHGADSTGRVKRASYALFAFGMMYAFPLVCIAYCYGRIVCVLTSRTREHRENCICPQHSASLTDSADYSRHQQSAAASLCASSKLPMLMRSDTRNIERARLLALRMTAAIVLCFLLCWAPHWALTLWDSFASNEELLTDGATDLVYVGLACAFFNSCANPIIYGMFTKHCRRLLNRRCHCLSKWLRRKRQRREWRQQQLVLPQHSPFHHHQRQMQLQQQQQQRHVGCQYEMIPMQDLQNQNENSKQKLENKATPEQITVRAESAATASAAVAALAPSGSSFSSGSARTYEKQQQQQLSLSSSRRLDRNAFDKMYPPIYDISPRTS